MLTVSAHTGAGLEAAWAEVDALFAARRGSGALEARRRAQAEAGFVHALESGLIARLAADPRAAALRRALARRVAKGEITPEAAAARVLDLFAPKQTGG